MTGIVAGGGLSLKLPGTPRTVSADSLGVARRANDPDSAFLSIRLKTTHQTKIVEFFEVAVVARGNANGVYFWSVHVDPLLSLGLPWMDVPGTFFEHRVHPREDHVLLDGMILASRPSMARLNNGYPLQYKLTGTEILVLVIEGIQSDLSHYASFNWREV